MNASSPASRPSPPEREAKTPGGHTEEPALLAWPCTRGSTRTRPGHDKGSQAGSILVYLAVTLAAFALLIGIGLTRFGSTVMGVLSPNCSTSARLMAESGVRYALARLRACADETCVTTAVTAMNGQTYVVDSSRGLSFSLSVSYDATAKTATVSATGAACNSPSITSPAQSETVNLPNVAVDPSTISITGFSAFTVPTVGTAKSLTFNSAKDTATFGNQLTSYYTGTWYGGSNALCDSGNCTLGYGLCSTFRFQFNPNNVSSSTHGDGFMWAIMSAETNTAQNVGGGGEMMGYSGDNGVTSILPPKLGMEFDTTYNYKSCGKPCPASMDNFACDASSDDHVAFLFWGKLTLSCNAARDDHVHGAGSGTDIEPYNSYNFDGDMDGLDGYYVRGGAGAWLWNSSPTYLVRYELDRPTSANAQGDYVYRERAWVVKSTDSYSSTLSDCTQTYTAAPTLSRTFALSPGFHQQMGHVFFGFTSAAGSYTQTVKVDQFALNFKGAPSAVTTPTAPTGYAAAYTFDEAANATAHDASANHNDGSLSGPAMWGPDVRSASGASLFVAPGSSPGLLVVPDAASLDLSSSGTIACWIWIRNYVNNAGIVHKGTSTGSSEAYSLQLTTSGKLALVLSNTVSGGNVSQTLESASGAVSSTGKWYHVAATWDASTLNLYVNGALSSSRSNTSPQTPRNLSTALLLGSRQQSSTTYAFDGMLDDVYLYGRALSAAEVAGLAAGHP